MTFVGTDVGALGRSLGYGEYTRYAVEVDALGRGPVGREVIVQTPHCSDWEPGGARWFFTAVPANPMDLEQQRWTVTDARPLSDDLAAGQTWSDPDPTLASGWRTFGFAPAPLWASASGIAALIAAIAMGAGFSVWGRRRARRGGPVAEDLR